MNWQKGWWKRPLRLGSVQAYPTLLLILLLAFALRLYGLANQSLWWDELKTWERATVPLNQMLTNLIGIRDQVPLYYWMMRFWRTIGTEPTILRLISVYFGTLSIPLVYKIGRRLDGQATGLLSAFLLAISPFHIWYSQEVRMYTLLPALLAVFGGNLDRLRVRRPRFDHADDHGSGWHRWTRRIQRRPWPYLVSATVVLLILAAPLLSIRLGSSDGGSAPSDSTARRSYDIVAHAFGPGWTGPLLITAEYLSATSPEQAQAWLDELRTDLAATPGVASVPSATLNPSATAGIVNVVPVGSPQDASTEDLVHRLRTDVLPQAEGTSHVGGATATAVDLADRLADRML